MPEMTTLGALRGPFSLSADHPDLLWIGLMSGTSTDGVDGVVAQFLPDQTCRVLTDASIPFDAGLRADLLKIQRAGSFDPDADPFLELERAINRLTGVYIDCTSQLLQALKPEERARVRAAGAHGQTLRHRPADGITLQHFNPALFHVRTAVSVVSDFRRADVALGGQGAPLVPAFHHWWLHGLGGGANKTQVVLNIGGFANLSCFMADGRVQGQDCGPGNVLMDAWVHRHLGAVCDRDGRWAASGRVEPDLLRRLLAHPYFSSPLPRSTGRDDFHLDWLGAQLQHCPGIAPADVQATLLELTVQSIAKVLPADCANVWVCGGGAFNGALMARLQAVLTTAMVDSTAVLGVDPTHMEALAFAWLTRQRLCGLPGNLPDVTGASQPVMLGSLTGL